MKTLSLALALLGGGFAAPALAADISTHVLDLARGAGGRDVPVTLLKRAPDGSWTQVATARTDAEGRVRHIGDAKAVDAGTYQLRFDMTGYPDAAAQPFFPEISVTFRVADAAAHYHVPVTVSPYGYSTYRGS